MITEDYVSFETAKLLKEKGFDEPVLKFYDHKGEVAELYYRPQNKSITGDTYKCPTLQMAMKWLRDVHKMYMYVAHDSMENTWFARVYNDYKTLSDVDNQSTYEEACESAIRYCLENLI
jgi:hypothetical protein